MNLAVVGLGLIGGSLALRLADAGHRVRGWDTDRGTRTAAGSTGIDVAPDLGDAVAAADVVVLAVPLAALSGAIADVAGLAPADAVLTDAGSVKGPAYAAARRAGLEGRFVGGHPMAGKEFAGFAAAEPTLFDGAAWVLVLEPDTVLAPWLRLAGLFTDIGARVVPSTAAEHDAAVARISHLPHFLAAALAAVGSSGGPLALSLAAGSFRDGTRVAGTPPELSVAMYRDNAAAVDAAVAETRHLLTGDPAELLRKGHAVRSAWPASIADRSPLNPSDPGLREQLLAVGREGGWLWRVADDRLSVQGPA